MLRTATAHTVQHCMQSIFGSVDTRSAKPHNILSSHLPHKHKIIKRGSDSPISVCYAMILNARLHPVRAFGCNLSEGELSPTHYIRQFQSWTYSMGRLGCSVQYCMQCCTMSVPAFSNILYNIVIATGHLKYCREK